MQVNSESIIDTAVDLRIMTLKAKEQGIIDYNPDENEEFLITAETFKSIKGNREHKVSKTNGNYYPYRYDVEIAGLKFFAIAPCLMYENDLEKLGGEN